MSFAALMSPVVPNKRQRSENSPASEWRLHTHDSIHEQRWPSTEPWSTQSSTSAYTPKGNHFDESWRLRPIDPAPSDDARPSPSQHDLGAKQCTTCVRASDVAPKIASGLDDLHTELSKLSVSSPQPRRRESSEPSKTPKGLIQTLDWSLERLNESVKVTREMIAQSSKENLQSAGWRAEKSTVASIYGDFQQNKPRPSPPLGEGGRRHAELPPLFTEDFRKSGAFDMNSTAPGGSPPPSGAFQGQTSTGSEAGRPRYPTLPSPASLSVSSSVLLPPMSPSIQGGSSRSPHAAHLEDLQHQLSTKTLAHKVLSGEHEKLLAAYSRLQVRCDTLSKKSTVSDSEIANLAEDRIRLQTDLEVAEARIEELQVSQEEIQKQQAMNGDQFLQIMAMSSQLQAKGANEMKRWKEDREAWAQERDALIERVRGLEAATGKSCKSADCSVDAAMASETDESPLSNSPVTLQKEVMELRRKLKEEQDRVKSSREEGCKLTNLLRELSGISKRLTGADA